MTTTNQVRKTFLDFFSNHGHEIVKSSPLVPADDPTLMFTSAGMVQFKNLFTGQETRDYNRATTAQKCLRAGGKHNDLDNVGFTARHHTFFEMMGNFSFGDYFKEDAIEFAWNLITKEYGLSKDKLLVTVYHTDDEAIKIWKKVAGLSDDKIIKIATSDNFWSAGDTGPCGPCTEIFYDHGDKIQGGIPGSAEEDGDRFIEIWNLVFMQYDQLANGDRIDLPNPSIDTGMGLERMTAVLQGTHDNYNIDLMRGLIEASADLTSRDPDGEFKTSHRVIADHLRASCFMLAEGILPSNEGRGYVLRRIMRRAMRHAHLLGSIDPLMHRLVPSLISQMGDIYPELKEAEALTVETLKTEELRFRETLERGLGLLYGETKKLTADEKLSGEVAFKLYDTYGFPLDLTQDVLKREQTREVDIEGFDRAMKKQREMARASWAGSGEVATEQLWFDIKEKHGSTEFLGYEEKCVNKTVESKIIALVNSAGEMVDVISFDSSVADKPVFVITNQTPFYAESGGQAGDAGIIKTSGAELNVLDTKKKLGSIFVHEALLEKGSIKKGDIAHMKVNKKRRRDIQANHSATHLLQAALQRNIGKHVAQKGSSVDGERLRFDISQPKALTAEEIKIIEAEVNDRIRMNSKVTTALLPIDEAKAKGAMAMFGEKYDDEVRVLSMGGDDPECKREAYSIELCGGTHVKHTGDIGLFKITSESALAAGVRRIEAVTGRAALEYFNNNESVVTSVSQVLKTPPLDILPRIKTLLEEKKKLEKEVSDLRRKIATGGVTSKDSDTKDICGVKFSARIVEGMPAKELKPMADEIKTNIGSGVVALISVSDDGKASLVVGVTKDLTEKLSAVTLVKAGAEKLGGKGGGGRPDMAQAGGPNGSQANDAFMAIEKILEG